MATWRSAGFAEPIKPTQMIVSGRHGYATTAGQFNFMSQEIGAGARECQAGHDAAALQHIDTVREALERRAQYLTVFRWRHVLQRTRASHPFCIFFFMKMR